MAEVVPYPFLSSTQLDNIQNILSRDLVASSNENRALVCYGFKQSGKDRAENTAIPPHRYPRSSSPSHEGDRPQKPKPSAKVGVQGVLSQSYKIAKADYARSPPLL